jgi:hypothetical protein
VFRQLLRMQVRLTEFREFYRLYGELETTVRKKGLRPRTLWGATVGAVNEVGMFTDYETISSFWDDTNAFQSDVECMNIWRQMFSHLDGHPRSELFESAAEIA